MEARKYDIRLAIPKISAIPKMPSKSQKIIKKRQKNHQKKPNFDSKHPIPL